MRVNTDKIARRVRRLLKITKLDLEAATTALSLLVHDWKVALVDGLYCVKGFKSYGYGKCLLNAVVACICSLLGC